MAKIFAFLIFHGSSTLRWWWLRTTNSSLLYPFHKTYRLYVFRMSRANLLYLTHEVQFLLNLTDTLASNSPQPWTTFNLSLDPTTATTETAKSTTIVARWATNDPLTLTIVFSQLCGWYVFTASLPLIFKFKDQTNNAALNLDKKLNETKSWDYSTVKRLWFLSNIIKIKCEAS